MMMKRYMIAWLLAMMVQGAVFAQRQQRFDFDGTQMAAEWQFLGQPDRSHYDQRNGRLRLYGSIGQLSDKKPVTFVGLPQTEDRFTLETCISDFDFEDNDEAGVALYLSDNCYVQAGVYSTRNEPRLRLRFRLLKHWWLMASPSAVLATEKCWLRVEGDEQGYHFSYSLDGKEYQKLETVERSLLSPAISGTTKAPCLGLYAYMGSTKYQSGYSYADFDYFDYRAQ
jgi:beta-xylosidase